MAKRVWLLRTTALLPVALWAVGAAAQTVAPGTGPTGGQVVAGQASIATAPNRTTVIQSTDRGVIDWQRFNIGSQHTVQFQQPGAGSWTLNRVVTADPSIIAGRIQANGGIAIVNQSGIVFGQGAQVDVGSLIASAPGITNQNFMAGRMRFDQPALPGARVENRGRITVPDRGIAVLAGPRVVNTGEIHARLGRVVLAGAETYALDLAGDGLISIDITGAVRGDGAAIVTNDGLIDAAGGSVLLSARAAGDLLEGLVRNTGRISANTEAGRAGQVALRAEGGGVEVTGTVTATGGAGQQGGRIAVQSGESVRVAAGALLDASGGAGGGTVLVGTTGVGRDQAMARRTTVERDAILRADATVLGQGGTIAINSTERTSIEATISARGGPQGGNGGFVELSGQGVLAINQAPVDVSAPRGASGSVLLDPQRIRVTDAAAGPDDVVGDPLTPTLGTITANTAPDTGAVLVRTADINTFIGNLILEAALGITVEAAVNKPLGNLTLRTLEPAGTTGLTGIDIGASVTLGLGSFAASTAGSFTITGAGSLAIGGTTSITATGPVAIGGNISASALAVATNGALTQSSGTSITVDGLSVTGIAGAGSAAASITLDRSGNAIAALGEVRATGDIAIHAGAGTLAINGASTVSGANVTLTAGAIAQSGGTISAGTGALAFRTNGAVSQSGGSVTAGTLNVTGAAGSGSAAASVDLDQATNAIAALGEVRATNAIAIHAGPGTLTIGTGAVVSGVGVSLIAATAIDQSGGSIGAGTGVLAFRTNGAVSQSGGTVTAGTLNVTDAAGTGNADSVTLDRSGNAIAALGEVRAINAIAIHAGTTGTLAINSDSAVSGVGVTLTAAAVTQSGGTVSAGTGALAFRTDGAVSQSGGTVTAGTLIVTGAAGTGNAAASVSLGQAVNAIAALGEVRAIGAIAIHAGPGTLTIGTGAVVSGVGVTLTAGAVTQSDGTVSAGTGALAFRTNGAVSQSGGTVTAGTLIVTGAAGTGTTATSVELGQSGNAIGALGEVGASSTIAIHAGPGTLAINGGSAVSGVGVTLTAAAVSQSGGTVSAGTGALAFRTNGAVSQSGGSVTAGTLIVTGAAGTGNAAASVSLGQATNAIAALGEVRADGAIAIHAGAGTLSIGTGALVSGVGVTLTATAAITQTDGTINAGSGALAFRTNDAVSQSGGTVAANSLDVSGAAGGVTSAASVDLAQAGNAIAAIGQVSATGDVSIRSDSATFSIGGVAGANITLRGGRTGGTAIDLTGTVSGTGVSLLTDGAVTQSGGSLAATSLSIGGASGSLAASVALNRSANAIAGVGSVQALGSVALHAGAGTLTIAGGTTVRGAGMVLTATGGLSQTGGSIIASSDGVAADRSLTLQSNGAVSQVGGTLTAGSLSVLGATGGSSEAGSVAIGQAGNTIGAIGTVRATGAITLQAGSGTDPLAVGTVRSSAGSVTLAADRALSLTGLVQGTAVTLSGTAIGIAGTGEAAATGGALILDASGAGGITAAANGRLTGASGQRVVLRADALALDAGAVLTLTGSLVEVGPRTAGTAVLLGTTGTGLTVDAATLGRLTGSGAAALRLGETLIGSDTVRGGALTLGTALSFTTGGLTLVAGGAIDLGANAVTNTGRDLRLHAGDTVTGSGTLQAASLTIRGADGSPGSTAGAVTLSGSANAIGLLDARSSGAFFLAHTGGALTVRQVRGSSVAIDAGTRAVTIEANQSGIVGTGDVDLRAASLVLGANAGIAAGGGQTLTLQVANAAVSGTGTLSAAGGTIEIGPSVAGTAITIGNANLAPSVLNAATAGTIVVGRSSFNGAPAIDAGSITVADAVSRSGGSLELRASGAISLQAAVDVGGGTLTLASTSGLISQTATGLITAGLLNASTTGNVTLAAGDPNRTGADPWNAIAALGTITAGGSLVLNAQGALSIGGAVQAANATIATRGALTLGAAGSVTTTGGTTRLAATGAISLAGTIDAGTGTVTLGSGAGITQTGGGITAGIFGASGTSISLAGGTNSLGAVALRALTGSLAFDIDGTLTLAGSVNLAVVGGTGTEQIGGLSAAENLSVSAATIIGGFGTRFEAGNGFAITLRADALSLDPATTIRAQNGIGALSMLAVGPRTEGRAMVIGGTDPGGALFLTDATAGRLLSVAAPLTLGRTVVAGSTVTAGDVVVGSALTKTGNLTLIAGQDILLQTTIGAISGDIVLSAGRDIFQSGGQSGGAVLLDTGLLAARASRDIRLLGNNQISTLAAQSVSGAVQIASINPLTTAGASGVPLPAGGTATLTGVRAATEVVLQAPTLTVAAGQPVVTDTGGTVTLRADSLDIQGVVQASGGTVALEPLTLGGIAIRLGGMGVGGTLSISNAELALIQADTLVVGHFSGSTSRALTTDAAGVTWGGTLRLIGSSVAIAGPLTTTSLEAQVAGALTDVAGAGIITAGRLTVRGLGGTTDAGSISLAGNNHRIGALDLRSVGALAIDLDANGGTVQAEQLRGGSIAVTAVNGGLTLGATGAGATATAGNLTLTASGLLTIAAPISVPAGNLGLTGGAVTVTSGIAITGGTLTILANTGDATVSGAISAGAVSVTSLLGAIGIGGTVTATAGNATLTASGAGITVNDAITASGNVVIDAGRSLVLNADVTAATAGSVTLRAGSGGNPAFTITQTDGVVGGTGGTTTTLVVNSRSGAATLGQANRIASLDATASGALSVTGAGALTVTRATGIGSVTLNAASLALTGGVSAGSGTVDLRTGSGGVSQTVAGIITAGTLTGSVATDVALTTAANAVTTTGAFSFGGDFALRTAGTLTVNGALTAGPGQRIRLEAGGSLALQATLTAPTVSLAATGGSIGQTASGLILAANLDAAGSAGVALNAGDVAGTTTTAWNQVGTLTAGSGGSGGFLLRNSADLAVSGLAQAAGTLALDTSGTLTLAAGGTLRANGVGGAVNLRAAGAVTLAGAIDATGANITTAAALSQTTGSITTTGLLAARATAIDLQAAGNAIAGFAGTATAGDVTVASTGTMTIGGRSGVLLHGGGTADIIGVSGNTVFLTAAGLDVTQAVTAAAASTATLRADAMAIGAAVSAAGGTVRLEQATPVTRAVSLGAENASALSLTTAELANVSAATLVIGRGGGQAGTITVAGDVAAPGSIGTLQLLGSSIAVNATLTGPALTDLRALSGDIAGAGRVVGPRLEARAAAGSVALTGASDVTELAGSAAGGFAFRDANGFVVAAPGIQAASVALSADAGNITQQAGAAITAGSLDARAAGGSVLLDGGSGGSSGADLNRIGTVTRLAAAGSGVALLRNAQGFDLAGLADNGGGGLLGTLRLYAASGNITQSAGQIRAQRLEVALPGGTLALGQANAIASLGPTQVAGDLTIVNGGSLVLAAPVDVGSFGGGSFGTATLTTTGGNLTQTAGARLSADRLVANALAGSVVLDGGGSTNPADLLRVADLGGGYAAQSMILRFGNAVTVTGLTQAGATSGPLSGQVVIEAPGIAIGTAGQGGTLLRAGSVVLRTQAEFDGPAIPGSGSIVQQGGAIEAGNLAASAPSGDVLLGLAANRFAALAPGVSASGAASARSLVAGGSIDIAEGGPGFVVLGGLQNNGAAIDLRSLGNLTFNAATFSAGTINLSAGGTVTIGSGGDLRSATLLTLNGGAGITVQGTLAAPDIVAATGGTFTLAGGTVAGGSGIGDDVAITAGRALAAGGTVSARDIRITTGTGDLANAGFNAGNRIDILAGGELRLTGIGVNADTMQARTAGFLTLSGGSYTIGRAVVFAGSAGIGSGAPVQVRPQTPGRFPAVVFDSRAPGTAPDPLAVVRADIAGLPPDQQATQVRLPNSDAPGAFGAASGAAAGSIRFNLDAGQSPLFLLIDGGSASGTVNTVGRIGIHGRGGLVELTGTIVDASGQRIDGQAAARLADATRPATGADLSRFRINDCIVSSFNCVTPSQVIVVPSVTPAPPPLIYGGVGRDPDAIIPNVSEEWTVPRDREDDEENKR
jgi:filamentous hemagglutinin family protein